MRLMPSLRAASNTFTVPTTFTFAPSHRIGFAERHLQCGQMDDAARPLA